MLNNEFEVFANKLCEYCMTKYVLPYMRERGVLMTYRAQIISIDSDAKTMVIQRPYDTAVTVPYSNTAENLQVGDFCEVFVLGDGSNSKVVSDSMLNTSREVWYGTSSTGATTAAKVVSTATGNFALKTGAMVRVLFTNGNTYNGTATLNVDGTGAVDIARVGTTKTTRYYWAAGEVVDFVYDGTNFVMSNKGTASTTYYGLVKLTTSATSTSTTLVPTASCVDAKIAAKVPAPPATAGTYTLQCTVASGGAVTYSWV